MLISVKGTYKIEGKVYSNLNANKIPFFVTSINDSKISVNIISDQNEVEAIKKVDVSDDMWVLIEKRDLNQQNLTTTLKEELSEIKTSLHSAASKVLSLCKYCLNWTDLDEKLISVRNYSWSSDQKTWSTLPTTISVTFGVRSILHITENYVQNIQKTLDESIEPFIAIRHLQKATIENNPRYKWIDATIAAELAIKEFYIRLKPDMEKLLLEVPSPPLHKLYGVILENYIGERSPKLKEISHGVEIRNRLIHRPENEKISLEKANEYINAIRAAINHLLTKLYPEKEIMRV